MPPDQVQSPPSTNVGTVTAVIAMALQTLSGRVVLLLAMVMTFGLFVAAMCLLDWLALSIAASFAVLVFWPVFWRTHAHKNG
jgi:hypothetical protein